MPTSIFDPLILFSSINEYSRIAFCKSSLMIVAHEEKEYQFV